MIRVLIAEDQSMVRGALAALLELEADIEVVAQVQDGREALERIELLEGELDVVLTDIEMPRLTGLDLAREVQALGVQRRGSRQRSKQGPESVPRSAVPRLIILTTFARPGYLRRALDAGVCGYLLKDAPAEQLADAVRRVNRGLRVIDPELAMAAWEEADPLTDRERQVLRLAGEGKTTPAIAGEIHLSEGTVRNYLSEAIGKLGARNRTEAARIARTKGWL